MRDKKPGAASAPVGSYSIAPKSTELRTSKVPTASSPRKIPTTQATKSPGVSSQQNIPRSGPIAAVPKNITLPTVRPMPTQANRLAAKATPVAQSPVVQPQAQRLSTPATPVATRTPQSTGRNLATARPAVKPYTSPVPKIASAQTRPSPSTPPINLSDKIKQFATFPGMSVDLNQLGNCSGKCELNFSDSRGSVVPVIFFKGGFEQKLISKGGKNLKLSGKVNQVGGRPVLLLQKVD